VEGRFGFLHAYSDGGRAAPITAPVLARDGHEILRTSIKPHACCRYMQGPIDAVLALRAAHGIDPEAVERVEVGMLDAGFAIVCEPADAKRRPASVVDAQFSLPFGIAVALARGAASPDEFTVAYCGDPAVRRLMERIVAVRDARLDARFPRAWPSWVRILLRGDATVEASVAHPRGDPENFPTAAELDVKFRALARRALSEPATTRLAAEIDRFAAADSARPLLRAATVT
jgi:2-methylcitrate dehydratase PrpD